MLKGALIHLVFHISLLKKKNGENAVLFFKLSVIDESGRFKVALIVILHRKLMNKGKRAATMRLVRWLNLIEEDVI